MAKVLNDIQDAISHSDPARRAIHLERVTDLFARDAPALSDDQIELFDLVIGRLASAIEVEARAQLAERLADIPNAPHGIVRALAHDEIEVARPVLARSQRLTDDDLVAVAMAKGRDHLLAMTERPRLTATVTDILVKRGDRIVVHKVAAHPGARFSPKSMDLLMERSRLDDGLHGILGRRPDIGGANLARLMLIAKETARLRLAGSVPGATAERVDGAVEAGASRVQAAIVPGKRDFSRALAAVGSIAETRGLKEADLAAFAAAGRFEETVCALSRLCGLSLATAHRMMSERGSELLIILAKAEDWDWPLLRNLMAVSLVMV